MQVYLMNISSNVADEMIQRKTVTLETGLHLAEEQAMSREFTNDWQVTCYA